MDTRYRLGTFFILTGLALLVLFVGSVIGKEIHWMYLFLGFVALFVAFLLQRNKPVKESGRFGTLHRARERNRQRRTESGNREPARSVGLFGAGRREGRPNRRNQENGKEKNQEK